MSTKWMITEYNYWEQHQQKKQKDVVFTTSIKFSFSSHLISEPIHIQYGTNTLELT